MWDSNHVSVECGIFVVRTNFSFFRLLSQAFSCLDEQTTSRLLVTTRIKGILADGNEVQLELLGLQEAVELLAGVAEINASQIPPVCLQIAQLW